MQPRFNPEEATRNRVAVRYAADEKERALRIHSFLEWLSSCLQNASQDDFMPVAFEVAYLLAENHTDQNLWTWIREYARSSDQRLREAFKIAFLELIPEHPKDICVLNLLWEVGAEPTAAWVLGAAYAKQPQFCKRDYAEVQEYRASKGLEALPPYQALRPLGLD